MSSPKNPGIIEQTSFYVKACLLILIGAISGCSTTQEPGRKNPPAGFIVTPPSSYTTQKGRYLGQRYHPNLERLVQQLVQNPATRNLQFANNLVSVGGIGFFTHSATRSADERYLEVVLGLPDLLDGRPDFSSKAHRLFSQYGAELLTILSSDSEIYNEKEVAGFGLNFSWRSASEGPSGPRIVLERVVAYFHKDETRRFVARKLTVDQLLGGAVIFVMKDESPASLLHYVSPASKSEAQPQAPKEKTEKIPEIPKLEPPVREMDLDDSPSEKKKKPISRPPPLVKAPKSEERKAETREKLVSKAEPPVVAPKRVAKESAAREPALETPKAEVKAPPAPAVAPEAKEPKREPPSEKKAEEKVALKAPTIAAQPPPAPLVTPPKLDEPKAALEEKASTATKVPVAAAKETIPKDRTEPVAEIPTTGVKASPAPAVASQVKEPRRESQPGKKAEEKVVVKDPASSARKETEERILQPSAAEVKRTPAPTLASRFPKREEAVSKKVTEPASAIAVKEPPSVPLVKPPTAEEPKVAVKERTNTATKVPEAAAKETVAVKDRRERVTETPEAEVKAPPVPVVAPQAKEPKRESPPEKKAEEKVALKAPTVPAGKEIKDRSLEPPVPELKKAPAPAPIAEIPNRQETPPKSVPEPPPAIATKEVPSIPSTKAPKQEEPAKKKIEQLALRKTPVAPQKEKPRSPALRGYIIQLSFAERGDAERWSDLLSQEGYATAMSVSSEGRPVRLRVGNFPSSAEAKITLAKFQKKGLAGLIVQLPK